MLPPQVNDLVDTLRARDDDPAFGDAPVLDVYGRISINPETGETEKVDRQIEDTLKEVLRRRACLGEILRDDGKSAWKAGALQGYRLGAPADPSGDPQGDRGRRLTYRPVETAQSL